MYPKRRLQPQKGVLSRNGKYIPKRGNGSEKETIDSCKMKKSKHTDFRLVCLPFFICNSRLLYNFCKIDDIPPLADDIQGLRLDDIHALGVIVW